MKIILAAWLALQAQQGTTLPERVTEEQRAREEARQVQLQAEAQRGEASVGIAEEALRAQLEQALGQEQAEIARHNALVAEGAAFWERYRALHAGLQESERRRSLLVAGGTEEENVYGQWQERLPTLLQRRLSSGTILLQDGRAMACWQMEFGTLAHYAVSEDLMEAWVLENERWQSLSDEQSIAILARAVRMMQGGESVTWLSLAKLLMPSSVRVLAESESEEMGPELPAWPSGLPAAVATASESALTDPLRPGAFLVEGDVVEVNGEAGRLAWEIVRAQNHIRQLRSMQADIRDWIVRQVRVNDAMQDEMTQLEERRRQCFEQARILDSQLPGGSLLSDEELTERVLLNWWHQLSRVASESRTIYDPDGHPLEAEVLRFGGMGALAKLGSGELLLAVHAPEGATGWRWARSASDDQAAQWAQAWEAGLAGEVIFLDPSGVLSEADLQAQAVPAPGLVARVKSGGLLIWPLFLIAGLGALLVIERFLALYVFQRGWNERSHRQLLRHVEAKHFDQVEALLAEAKHVVAGTLAACFRVRRHGQSAMEDATQAHLLQVMPMLTRSLSTIRVCAAAAPLLGLLGTVTGIIRTFEGLGSAGAEKQAMMAAGISEALMTTALGLVIAIPLLLLGGWVRGRADRLLAECEAQAASLLTRYCLVYADQTQQEASTDV